MLYLCRWPNGEVSLVGGRDRVEIDKVLDEVANPDIAEMIPIEAHSFAMHFRLIEKADRTAEWITDLLELQDVSVSLQGGFAEAYPLLAEAFVPDKTARDELIAGTVEQIATVLENERTRVEAREVELSDDLDAAYYQHRMDLPKRVAEELAGKSLEYSRRRTAIIRRIRKPSSGIRKPRRSS